MNTDQRHPRGWWCKTHKRPANHFDVARRPYCYFSPGCDCMPMPSFVDLVLMGEARWNEAPAFMRAHHVGDAKDSSGMGVRLRMDLAEYMGLTPDELATAVRDWSLLRMIIHRKLSLKVRTMNGCYVVTHHGGTILTTDRISEIQPWLDEHYSGVPVCWDVQ